MELDVDRALEAGGLRSELEEHVRHNQKAHGNRTGGSGKGKGKGPTRKGRGKASKRRTKIVGPDRGYGPMRQSVGKGNLYQTSKGQIKKMTPRMIKTRKQGGKSR